MAFRSSGTLEQDIKDIGIKQMGKSEYNELNDGAKKLLDSYAKDLVGALKAFLMRQEFQITDMDAVGTLLPNKIQIAGGVSGPTPGLGAPIVGPVPVAPANNIKPVPIKVQISQTSNKVGLLDVHENVKPSVIKLLKPKD
mgnify:CR=1 FL=1